MAADRITWAGRTLSGVDRYGKWVTTNLEGWWDSPEPKGETVDRPGADGEYSLPLYNEARLITITGGLHTPSHEESHEAMSFLTGTMSGQFHVAGHGPSQWCQAVKAAAVKFTIITDTYTQWQVRLKAPDPRKFGARRDYQVTPGTPLTVHHKGNYGATPVWVVSGNIPSGYHLHIGDFRYEVDIPLQTGKPHRIDYRTGRLDIHGVPQMSASSYSKMRDILPGERVTARIDPLNSGTAIAELQLYDTYI